MKCLYCKSEGKDVEAQFVFWGKSLCEECMLGQVVEDKKQREARDNED